MKSSAQKLKEKRQYFHKLLIALGEDRFKDVIIGARFGVDSTTSLTEEQMDDLITDAIHRLDKQKPNPKNYDARLIKMWRNKCLLVLNERGITATPKDWAPVNNELAKKQYQWIMTADQHARGIVNHKGLYAFNTVDDLKKLFKQLASIRDNERIYAEKLKDLMLKN